MDYKIQKLEVVMEQCVKCGKMMTKDSMFCPNCGSRKEIVSQMPTVSKQIINNQNSNGSKINISKIIFDIFAFICGLLMLVSLNMDVVDVEVEDFNEKVSCVEAFENVLDFFDYVVEEGIEEGEMEEGFNSTWAFFSIISLLIPIVAIIDAIWLCISKMGEIIKYKKGGKIQVGNLCSLLMVQFLFMVYGGLLAMTDSEAFLYVEYYRECEVTMQMGWWIVTVVIAMTLIYGVISAFLQGMKNGEKNPSKLVAMIAGVIMLLFSYILCYISPSAIYEFNGYRDYDMSNCVVATTLFDIFEASYNEEISWEESIEIFVPMLGIFITMLVTLIINCESIKNSLIAIISGKVKYIFGIIVGIINILTVVLVQYFVDMLVDSEIYEDLDDAFKVLDVSAVYMIVGIFIVVVNIAYVVVHKLIKSKMNT